MPATATETVPATATETVPATATETATATVPATATVEDVKKVKEEVETEELFKRKKPISRNEYEDNWWFYERWYLSIKNWLILSIAKTYYTERIGLHKLYSNFSPKKMGNNTIKMFLGNLITIPIIVFSYFIGFGNFIFQCFLNNIIYSLVFFLLILIIGIFIGFGQLFEFLIKLIGSPVISSGKEIMNLIGSQEQLMIFIFSMLWFIFVL